MEAIQYIFVFLSIAVHVVRITLNLVISRCFAEEDKKNEGRKDSIQFC